MFTNELKPPLEEALEHYGVLGMKWGVRRTPEQLGRARKARKTERAAQKDAKEFAAAKMFYGTGAGTRRKLIKESVEAKKKRDPEYAKAFDRHLEKQDMSKHAVKATKTRKSTDRKVATKQTTGAVARRLTGEMGTKAAFVALIAGGAAYMNSPAAQATMKKAMSSLGNTSDALKRRQGARQLKKLLNL